MVGSGTCAGGGDIGADIALWCCGAVGVVLGMEEVVVMRIQAVNMVVVVVHLPWLSGKQSRRCSTRGVRK